MMSLRYASLAGLLVATGLCGGCDDSHRGAPSAARKFTSPQHAPPQRVPLTDVPLATQADFDALEDEFLTRRRPDALVATYERLAQLGETSKADTQALLEQRLAILLVDARGGTDWLGRGLRRAEALHERFPGHPHVHYLDGYIKRKLLISAAGARALTVTPDGHEAAEHVLGHWTSLLAVAPAYVGPQGHDAAQIREDLDHLRRALAAPPSPDSNETVVASAASSGARAALTERVAFEDGGDAERKLICRERTDRELVGGPSIPEARLDLECAIFAHDPEAITFLKRLIAAGGSVEGCAWAARIRAGVPRRAKRVEEGLRELGLADCR